MKKHSSFLLALLPLLLLAHACASSGPPLRATPTSIPIASVPTSSPSPTPLTPTLSPSPVPLTPTPTASPVPLTPTPSPLPTSTPIPKVLLPVRGLYVSFERRGSWWGYYSGDVITHFDQFDSAVGHTISEEVSLQLDAIKQMGVNTIAFELQSSDSTYSDPHVPPTFPTCNISPDLGLLYPQPPPSAIRNLVSFFDLVHSKGMKVFLRLVITHMEEQPPANNQLWLGTILKALKDHPALDLVLFEGTPHMWDSNGDGVLDQCDYPAEPALWEGPTSVAARYVKWALQYAHSIGLPYRKLSAEAIVGDYYTYRLPPSGPGPNDPHPFDPIHVFKLCDLDWRQRLPCPSPNACNRQQHQSQDPDAALPVGDAPIQQPRTRERGRQ